MIRTTKPSILDPESREILISLKKILFLNCIWKELRDMTPQIFKKNAWVALSGIDAINCHFSGKNVHTSLVEIVLVPLEGFSTEDQTLAEISDILVKACNEKIMTYANMETLTVTKGLVEKASSEAAKTGIFFSKRVVNASEPSGSRCFIDFHLANKQPFIEIKVAPGLRILDRYGVKFVTLKDVKILDNERRTQQIDQALSRPDLTFTNSCMKVLVRLCFPAYHMRKLESSKEVESCIKSFSGIGDVPLLNTMLQELKDYKNDARIRDITLTNFVERAVKLGLLLPGLSKIINDYNDNVLYETRTEILG